MVKKLKMLLYAVSASVMLLVPTVVMPLAAHAATNADINNELCSGADLNFTVNGGSPAGCGDTGNAVGTVNNIVALVINIFSVVVGIIAVIMIIIGGIRYVTSGGNDQSVASAKNTILYAIIGLIIVALAQIVVKFVLNKVVNS